jgi:hypothetical protein
METVSRCDELWVVGNLITSGMGLEIGIAKKLGIPVKEMPE